MGGDLGPANFESASPTVAFTFRPIGIAHLSRRRRIQAPKCFVPLKRSTLEIFQPYLPGLTGLYEGIELWIITCRAPSGHCPQGASLGGDGVPGAFAGTTLQRPNPIEFLRARTVAVDRGRGLLQVVGLDVEEGDAILDIRLATFPHHRLTLPGE